MSIFVAIVAGLLLGVVIVIAAAFAFFWNVLPYAIPAFVIGTTLAGAFCWAIIKQMAAG